MPDGPAFQPSPIRFRVWDGERMHAPEDSGSYALTRTGDLYNFWANRPESESVALLSTGFRDADGREVYEGDYLLDLLNSDLAPTHVYRAGACLGTDYTMPLPNDLSRYRVSGNVYAGVSEPA